VSFKTKYSAVYGSNEPRSNRYKHEVEPEVLYSKIPYVDRPDHIFFGNFEDQPSARRNEAVSNSDFRGDSGVQFDYRDRLFDKDLVTFVLSNYLTRKKYLGDTPSYQRFVTFRLSQSYDFNVAAGADPRPWSNLNGLLDIRQQNFETHTTADFYPYANATNLSTRLKFISDNRNYLELVYTDTVVVNEDQDNFSNPNRTLGTGLGLQTKYLDLGGRTNFSLINEKIESWEYTALIKPPGDCWTIKFGHKQAIGSDTVFKFSFNFEFSGI
jgi:LPS-assembly protein